MTFIQCIEARWGVLRKQWPKLPLPCLLRRRFYIFIRYRGPLELLTMQHIEEHIRRHWAAFENKDTHYLEHAYSQSALIFTTSSKRVELGRLVIMHRQREYLAPQTRLRIDLRDIYVQITGERTALAAYILEFHAENLGAGPGRRTDEHHSSARITQVFERSDDNSIRITHEHISVAQ